MTQRERREYLTGVLLEEGLTPSPASLLPDEAKDGEKLLHTLLCARPASPVSEDFLQVQDDYLKELLLRRGVVDGDALEETAPGSGIVIWQGDISRLKCGAVVNSASPDLSGRTEAPCDSPDHVIHLYAGLRLREACSRQIAAIREKLGDTYVQPVGIPMITEAFLLPAKKIVHVVAPAVDGELTDTHREQLRACYKNVLMLCEKQGVASVAFCCIGTGFLHFPQREAAEIAVQAVKAHLEKSATPGRVIFNVFTDEDRHLYEDLLDS